MRAHMCRRRCRDRVETAEKRGVERAALKPRSALGYFRERGSGIELGPDLHWLELVRP
jgi:hypothetical protein